MAFGAGGRVDRGTGRWCRQLGSGTSDAGAACGAALWRARCGQEGFLREFLRSHEVHVIGDIGAERAGIFGRWHLDPVCERKKRRQRDTVKRRGIFEDRPLGRGEKEIVALDGIAVEEIVSALVKHLIEPGRQGALYLGLAARVVDELADFRVCPKRPLDHLEHLVPVGLTASARMHENLESADPERDGPPDVVEGRVRPGRQERGVIRHVERAHQRNVLPGGLCSFIASTPAQHERGKELLVDVALAERGAEQGRRRLALEARELMRAEKRRRAADQILVVSVEHPGVDRECLAEKHAMSARMPELQRPAVRDRGERDEVAETRQRRDVAKDWWRGRVQDQDRGFELLSEIVGETVEEAPKRRMRPLEGRNAAVVRGRERRDVAADRSFQRNIRQDEYRRPIDSHVLFLFRRASVCSG